jgi:hypothetical protein
MKDGKCSALRTDLLERIIQTMSASLCWLDLRRLPDARRYISFEEER